ncbi:MAG: YkgJ family cysteine cluster protein [Candidatus Woesearchaeota archaeon]
MKQNVCLGCGTCCSHVAVEIDKPVSKEEFQEIIWFVIHQNIRVFIEEDGSWNIEFKTPCNALNKERKCDIYTKRPTICRSYSADNCEKNGEGSYYKHIFRTREDVLDYVRKHTKIKSLT